MKIDETTGLPTLPEGYFWRIKKDSSDDLSVSIQKRNKRRGSTYISGYWTTGTSTVEAIQIAANTAYERWQEELFEADVEGDYPPMRLPS